MNPIRWAWCVAAAVATTIVDHWHPPGPVLGYDSDRFYADN